MAIYKVLGIGYPLEEQDAERQKWAKHGIYFDFSDTLFQAAEQLLTNAYACIVFCTDYILSKDIVILRNRYRIPIVIMPPEFTAKQRQAYSIYSVIQYIHASGVKQSECLDSVAIHNYFASNLMEPKPLTIITAGNLSICIEQRLVEICGQEISLTAKEFDILSLLICNQRQVFTHEMIVNRVWKEASEFYSRKIVSTHISNIRKKLNSASKNVDYIKSVRGVGYRFNADG